MRATPGITTAYGLLVMVLGVLGYINAKSVISLVVGGSLGMLVVLCSLIMGWQRKVPSYLAAFFVAILFVSFSIRFYKSTKYILFIMSVLSLIVFFLLIRQIFSKSIGKKE